jgi:hypothetical protein
LLVGIDTELVVMNLPVPTRLSNQVLMAARLSQTSLLEDENEVSVGDGRNPVGDNEDSFLPVQVPHRLL